jgi:Secretion system C-terminal sorting domain/Fibronectin type III domain
LFDCITFILLKSKPKKQMKNKFYITSIILAFVLSISHLNAQTNCPSPTGLTSANITANGATVSWLSAANNAIYNVRYRTTPNSNWQTVTAQTTSINLTNLLPQTTYEWQVQTGCIGINGTVTLSVFSGSAFFTTLGGPPVCNVPTGLFANNQTTTSATLHWNSTGATSYKVRYRVSGTTAWTNTGSATNSKNLTGLTSATAYQWQVRSKCVNSTGTITFSAWSASSYFQTIGATSCTTPTGLSANTQGTNGVALSWNSTGANSYNIRYKTLNTATWTTTTSVTNSKTLTGLLPGTGYEWQVQGVCMSNGVIILSAWSASSFFTTNSPLSLSPNPAIDKITITHESTSSQEVTLTIHDFLGTAHASLNKSALAGTNQYEVNVSNLKNGIYYIELKDAEGIQTMKFYVQH